MSRSLPTKADSSDLALRDEPEARLSLLSVTRHGSQADKRDRYFVKGPLSFEWIRKNIPDPTSRVVLVAHAFMDMTRKEEISLNAKIWDCAGVKDRDQRRRVLGKLRAVGGSFEIKDRRGRTSVIKKIAAAD